MCQVTLLIEANHLSPLRGSDSFYYAVPRAHARGYILPPAKAGLSSRFIRMDYS
jgi:hypothetical protein